MPSESPATIERIDPLAGGTWDSSVTAQPGFSVFHLSAWARILAETYAHQPIYLRIMAEGRQAALVPLMEVRSPLTGRRGVSLPFADFAGPLWSAPDRKASVSQALLTVAAERKWKHLELRGGPTPAPAAHACHTYHGHELDLTPGLSLLAQQLPASTRRSIRKAERSGLTLTIGRDPDAMRTFYQLHGRTRRRHGLPPQPFSFFEAIQRHLIDPGLGVVIIARRSGAAVAGAVFLHAGEHAIYKFGASDPDHWNLRPNHRVMWSAIEYLVASGCRSLHFGRTANDDAGLIRFKQSWAAAATTLSYYRYDTSQPTWIIDRKTPAASLPLVFGHLPLALGRFAGRLIYPHLD